MGMASSTALRRPSTWHGLASSRPAGSRFVNDPFAADTGSGMPPIVDMGAYERLPADCGVDGGWARNGDVNLLDYAGLEACVGVPLADPPGDCTCFDLDGSGEIDLLDFAVFQVTFTAG